MPKTLSLATPAQPGVFAAYPGSLVQQHYGERVGSHGYLLWDLEENTVTSHDIKSFRQYHTVEVGIGTDYDALNFQIEDTSKLPQIRIRWTDTRANQTIPARAKLMRYCRGQLGATEVKFICEPPDQAADVVFLSKIEGLKPEEQHDFTDPLTQQKLIAHYLREAVQADEGLITEILTLDKLINGRLVENGQTILGGGTQRQDFRILRVTLENFRSIEGPVTFDWSDQSQHGLWQIMGPNESGKTSLLDGICYILYGKTIGTERKVKFGDDRFVNNKIDCNHCEGIADILIGGQYYRLIRRTTREWKTVRGSKDRELKACPTTFTCLRLTGPNGDVIANDSDEGRRATDALLARSLGNFDDFLRQALITSDTLNELLSIEHSVFVDAVLRDLGLAIFERKLEIFRAWKKDTYGRTAKIQVDPEKEMAQRGFLVEEEKEFQKELVELESKLKETETAQKKGEKYLTEQRNTLVPYDLAAAKLDPQEIQRNIEAQAAVLRRLDEEGRDVASLLQAMPPTPDPAREQALTAQRQTADTNARAAQRESQHMQQRIHELGAEISGYEQEIIRGVERLQQQQTQCIREVDQIKERATELTGLGIDPEAVTCPTCGGTPTGELRDSLQKTVLERSERVTKLLGADIQAKRVEYRTFQDAWNTKKQTLETSLVETKEKLEKERVEYARVIKEAQDLSLEADRIGELLAGLSVERQQEVTRQNYTQRLNQIPIEKQNADLRIQHAQQQLTSYNQAQQAVQRNKTVEEKIKKAEERLEVLREEWLTLTKRITQVRDVMIPELKRGQEEITRRLAVWEEQSRREQIHKLYEDALHRDGLPTVLLRRTLTTLNDELERLLADLSFQLFLDEDLQFRLRDLRGIEYKEPPTIHILQASGMERTFASLVLRLGLRRMGPRGGGNLLLLDEVLGKLDATSLQHFATLLATARRDVEIMIMIEHGYADVFTPDHVVQVSTDHRGVSQIKINSPLTRN